MFAEYGKEYGPMDDDPTGRAKEIELDGTRTGQERGNTESGLRLPDLEHCESAVVAGLTSPVSASAYITSALSRSPPQWQTMLAQTSIA